MTATASTPRARWLFGPLPDLLVGCGLAWMLAAVAHAAVGGELQRWVPGSLLVLALSFPHYGATLLRVYELPEERRRYRLLAIHGSLVLAILFLVGLRSVLIGSLILTLYMTWSPWHYTGQNYGVFLMLLRRRGVSISPLAKRLVYVSFLLSFALTVLALHGVDRAASYAPDGPGDTIYRLLPLGIPPAIAGPAIVGVGAAYVASLVGAAVLLLRVASVRDLAPSAVLALTQSLWFSVPVLARYGGLVAGTPLAPLSTAYGFLWVAAAHAAQYLWVTTYYASASGASRNHLRYLGKTALAGYAIWTVPALLFAPRALGGASYDAGLALMIAAVVNLHHFVLDGAIWKLRDGRIARLLLRSPEVPAESPAAAPGRLPWLAPSLWTVGALCVAVSLFGVLETEFGFRRGLEGGELGRAGTSLDRLAWVGRDSAQRRLQLGNALARRGEGPAAMRQFTRSLELRPSAGAWSGVAALHAQRGQWLGAARAYDQALAVEPDSAKILYRSGLAWMEAGRADEARLRLTKAAQLAPESEFIGLSLERAVRASTKDPDPAATAGPPRPETGTP